MCVFRVRSYDRGTSLLNPIMSCLWSIHVQVIGLCEEAVASLRAWASDAAVCLCAAVSDSAAPNSILDGPKLNAIVTSERLCCELGLPGAVHLCFWEMEDRRRVTGGGQAKPHQHTHMDSVSG